MKTKKTAWSINKTARTKLINELTSLSKSEMKNIFESAHAKNEKKRKKVPDRTLGSLTKELKSIRKEVKFPVTLTVEVTAYLGIEEDWVGLIDSSSVVIEETIPGLSQTTNFSDNLYEILWEEEWLPDSVQDALKNLREKYKKCMKRIDTVAKKYDMDPLELAELAFGY